MNSAQISMALGLVCHTQQGFWHHIGMEEIDFLPQEYQKNGLVNVGFYQYLVSIGRNAIVCC